MNAPVAFVDTETTGLAADYHEIWEVGLIVDGEERSWQLPIDLKKADPKALDVGRFHERYDVSALTPVSRFAAEFMAFFEEIVTPIPGTNAISVVKRHLVGAVISFDEERLRKLLAPHRHPQDSKGWHYHLVDVEALAAGKVGMAPPWNSETLSRAVGVEPERFDRHTALGDARWAKAIYEAVVA